MSAENKTGSQQGSAAPHGQEQAQRPAPPQIRRGPLTALAVIVVIAAVIIAVAGILARRHAAAELRDYTGTIAAPPVSLVEPKMEKGAHEIVLPGNMQAFTQAPI